MAALFSGDDNRNFHAEDDYRAYLISRNPPPIVHHSAATHWKRLRVHTRRIQRELQLRGIRYPQRTDDDPSSHR